MTTTNRRAAPEPLTLFGRPWQGHEVLVPMLIWIITAGVPFGLYLTPIRHGAVFWLSAAGAVAAATVLGFALGGTRHCVGMVTAWCTLTPLTAGGWVLLTVGLGPRTGWLYVVWLVLAAASVVLFINARREQFDHEFDHHNGVHEAERRREELMRRRLAATMPAGADPEPFPALSAKDRECLKFEQLLATVGAGPGPDRATLVRAGLARPPAPGEHLPYTNPDSRLTVFERIPNEAGFTLWVKLPDDASVSYDTIRALAGKLEQLFGAKLPEEFPHGSRPGCVRVQRGVSSRTGEPIVTEVYIHVDVRDVLAKTLTMPENRDALKPISIYEAFQIGQFADGSPIMLRLAEIHALIVGRTRMGKSNLLNLLTRQLGRCYDVLIWGYDGKGGRWVRPYLKPWRDRVKDPHTDAPLARPFFDWCAISLTEFERIVDAGIELAVQRPNLPYASGSGWKATRELPWVLILADELSEAAAANGASGEFVDTRVMVTASLMQDKLARLVRLGAGEGVSLVAAQQRGTVTSGMSGDGKSQLGGRILLPVKAGEAGEVLADADPETIRLTTALRKPGSVVIEGFGNDESLPGKLWLFAEPEDVDATAARVVRELTFYRPALDVGSAEAIEKFGYSTRWTDPDRTAWLYNRKPSRPLLRWSAEEDMKRSGGGTATATRPAGSFGPVDQPIARTRAEQYGLQDVPDPFAPSTPAPTNPTHAEPRDVPADDPPAPAEKPLGDQEAAAQWAAAEAAFADEMGWRAQVVEAEHAGVTPPPPPPAVAAQQTPAGPPPPDSDEALMYGPPLRTVEPTFERLWPELVEIVNAAGDPGTSAADVGKILKDRNRCPSSRGTVNSWLDKLADSRRIRRTGEGRSILYHPVTTRQG